MNDTQNCIADLLDNYDLSYLLQMAKNDDGSHTIACDGSDFSVDCIADALEIILNTKG